VASNQIEINNMLFERLFLNVLNGPIFSDNCLSSQL
jgi:hypothetical protein